MVCIRNFGLLKSRKGIIGLQSRRMNLITQLTLEVSLTCQHSWNEVRWLDHAGSSPFSSVLTHSRRDLGKGQASPTYTLLTSTLSSSHIFIILISFSNDIEKMLALVTCRLPLDRWDVAGTLLSFKDTSLVQRRADFAMGSLTTAVCPNTDAWLGLGV